MNNLAQLHKRQGRFADALSEFKQALRLYERSTDGDDLTVTTILRADFPDGLAVDSELFSTMRDVFNALGLGKLIMDAEPASAKEVSSSGLPSGKRGYVSITQDGPSSATL